jgi:hypothetical protein
MCKHHLTITTHRLRNHEKKTKKHLYRSLRATLLHRIEQRSASATVVRHKLKHTLSKRDKDALKSLLSGAVWRKLCVSLLVFLAEY